jgi:hypothetical protein
MTYLKLEKNDLKLEKTDLKLEKTDLKLEKTDLKLEKTDLKLEKTDLKLEMKGMFYIGRIISDESNVSITPGYRIVKDPSGERLLYADQYHSSPSELIIAEPIRYNRMLLSDLEVSHKPIAVHKLGDGVLAIPAPGDYLIYVDENTYVYLSRSATQSITQLSLFDYLWQLIIQKETGQLVILPDKVFESQKSFQIDTRSLKIVDYQNFVRWTTIGRLLYEYNIDLDDQHDERKSKRVECNSKFTLRPQEHKTLGNIPESSNTISSPTEDHIQQNHIGHQVAVAQEYSMTDRIKEYGTYWFNRAYSWFK